MIDLGVSKLALIGAVALIVIGPEKLPRVARMVGTMIGRAQRYVSDVKAEVNRSMDLDELKKMKETVEGAARDVENSIQTSATDFEKSWEQVTNEAGSTSYESFPTYSRPHKKMAHEKQCHAALVQAASWRAHQCAIGRGACGTLSRRETQLI